MPVHIGQMTTDVIADSSSSPSGARDANEAPPEWSEAERQRKVREQHAALRWRTSSEGYDD